MNGNPTPPRRWGTWILAALLLAAGAGAWSFHRAGRGPEFRLPDGTTVRVRQVHAAAEHFSPFDPLPVRVGAMLPAALRRRLPASVKAVAYSLRPGTSIACWFEFDRVPDVIRTNGGMGGGSALQVTLHDGGTFRVRSDQDYSGQLKNGGYFEAHSFPVPLPTDRPLTFDVHFKQNRWSEQWGPVPPDVTWRQRVRVPRTPAVPDAEPIPASRVVGDLRVVLTNLSVGVIRDPHPSRRTGPLDTWAFAGLSIEDTTGSGVHWEVTGLRVHSDVSGTILQRQSWIHEQGRMWWQYHFWPDQPWRLGFELGRTNGFQPGELAEFIGLDPTNSVPVTRTLDTGTVTLKSVVRSTGVTPPALELKVEIEPVRQPARLRLVRAVDSRGNPLRDTGTTWSDREATFRIDAPGNGPVDVTLALYLTREVEFVVRPTIAPR